MLVSESSVNFGFPLLLEKHNESLSAPIWELNVLKAVKEIGFDLFILFSFNVDLTVNKLPDFFF